MRFNFPSPNEIKIQEIFTQQTKIGEEDGETQTVNFFHVSSTWTAFNLRNSMHWRSLK